MLSFAGAMPMAKVAAMTREHDTRIWRVVEHHVLAARDQLDCSGVCRVGMDETSAAKGQDYISIFADLEARRVVFATEGRSSETVERFAADLVEHGGNPPPPRRACHYNCVSHGWTKIGRCDRHSAGKGTICESGHQRR